MQRHLVVVGSGWAGYTLSHALNLSKFRVSVVSPQSNLAYTPLLASAACGLFDFRVAEEPIRKQHPNFSFIQAKALDVDFKKRKLLCEPAFDSLRSEHFGVNYDILVLAPGCEPNTFGTPGVAQHARFLRNVQDAMKVRHRLIEMIEMANLPVMTPKQIQDMLHIIIVGGGPTGIEMAAEISDLFEHDLAKLYPQLMDKMTIAIHDVAPKILGPFEEKLSEYATKSLKAKNVRIKTNSHITNVTPNIMTTKEDGDIPYGMLLWATGNKNVELVDKIQLAKSKEGLPRMLTDSRLRAKTPTGSVYDDVYAMGDAADVEGQMLPMTAEVATQKAEYLARTLNAGAQGQDAKPFSYATKGLITYTGSKDGVVQGDNKWTGYSAWVSWRSVNLFWPRSWRRKAMVIFGWLVNAIDGRDIARK